ncbi:MAG: cysteine desulfurase [Clostridiales Family XIII bacterium]|jgi:cysteine desulfurase|nr:cysteine desulfurase [Clostridiales Family XIII bacterium]
MTENKTIYLDNAATTRVAPEVAAVMARMLTEEFGNPSSLHRMGLLAEKAVKKARAQVAAALGCAPRQVVFTGSGTEADNLALSAPFRSPERIRGRKIILSAFEHPAVREPALYYASLGAEVVFLPVDAATGSVRPADLAAALDEDTVLVSVMHVNNETGAVQPIRELAALCAAVKNRRGEKPLFHTDMIQSFGKLPVDLTNVDLASISAHKIAGPKGVGALFVRKPEKLAPLIRGGGQEGGLRSGTENTAGIAALGVAAQLAAERQEEHYNHALAYRRELAEGVRQAIPHARIHDAAGQSPFILSVSFPGARGEVLVHDLTTAGIYAATGSACSNIGKKAANPVLAAAGYTEEEATGTLRLSTGYENSMSEIPHVIQHLTAAAARF